VLPLARRAAIGNASNGSLRGSVWRFLDATGPGHPHSRLISVTIAAVLGTHERLRGQLRLHSQWRHKREIVELFIHVEAMRCCESVRQLPGCKRLFAETGQLAVLPKTGLHEYVRLRRRAWPTGEVLNGGIKGSVGHTQKRGCFRRDGGRVLEPAGGSRVDLGQDNATRRPCGVSV